MINQSLVALTNSVLGYGKQTARGNYAYHCPLCKHHKPKLEVNMSENSKGENPWHCWVCDKKGKKLYQLFKAVEVAPEVMSELKAIVKYVGPETDVQVETKITLPKEFKPLTNIQKSNIMGRHALAYIKSRGITEEDVLKYGIGYCETGRYANMVIIPSYDERGNINDPLHRSLPFLTKYEYTKILGLRATQIEHGSSPLISVDENVHDAYLIAKEEILQKKRIFVAYFIY